MKMFFRPLLIVAGFICIEQCLGENNNHKFSLHGGQLKEIPKRFEIKGENALNEFKKYLNEIKELANKFNVTVKYKVKVEVSKPEKKYNLKAPKRTKKPKSNKNKSKKYNIPLKKKSMKLSNFEIIMRKHAESVASRVIEEDELLPVTTEKQLMLFTTRYPRVGKYKPVINLFKTNYSKVVKPVRNKVITLTA